MNPRFLVLAALIGSSFGWAAIETAFPMQRRTLVDSTVVETITTTVTRIQAFEGDSALGWRTTDTARTIHRRTLTGWDVNAMPSTPIPPPSPAPQPQPTPPPIAGRLLGHLPAGFTIYASRTFDEAGGRKSGTGAGCAGVRIDGWDGIECRKGGMSIIPSDGPAGGHAMRFLYHAQTVQRGRSLSPGIMQHPIPSLSTVYVGVVFKVSDGWQGHPSRTNKLFYVWARGAGGYGPSVFPRLRGAGAGRLTLNIGMQGRNVPDARTNGGLESGLPVSRGAWHTLELLMETQPGTTHVRVWLDGAQALDDQVRTAIRSWDQLQVNPIWGGGGGTLLADQTLLIDHVLVAGR